MEQTYSQYIPLVFIAVMVLIQLAVHWGAFRAKGKRVEFLQQIATAEQQQKQRLIIYFWSSVCGPCHAISPMISELMTETGAIIKLDALEYGTLADKLGARGAPAFAFIDSGIVQKVHLGTMTKQQLRNFLVPQ